MSVSPYGGMCPKQMPGQCPQCNYIYNQAGGGKNAIIYKITSGSELLIYYDISTGSYSILAVKAKFKQKTHDKLCSLGRAAFDRQCHHEVFINVINW